MFHRPENTYYVDFDKINMEIFLNDEANPLLNIVNIIHDNAKVLDIGAGNGFLGWIIKNIKPTVIIDGIEPSLVGSSIAKTFYRNFYSNYFHEVKEKVIKEEYDYIVFADVLEHIVDPYDFLSELLINISKKTKIIISVPNIAHGSVRLSLLNGSFNYVDSGLLEKTHVRFFTLKTLEDMIRRLDMHIESLYYLKRPFDINLFLKIKPSFLSIYKLLHNNEALTYQYLVVIDFNPVEKKIYYKGSTKIFKDMFFNLIKKIFEILKKFKHA